MTLFEENFTSYIGHTILGECKSCPGSITPLQYCRDYPWIRRLHCVKERMDHSSPLDEEEMRYHAAWKAVVRDNSSGLCLPCCVKRNKKK
jgi:hypothetical protein